MTTFVADHMPTLVQNEVDCILQDKMESTRMLEYGMKELSKNIQVIEESNFWSMGL
jgi:hypothetical protein